MNDTEAATAPTIATTTVLKGFQVRVLQGQDAGRSLSVVDEAVTLGSADANQLVLRDRTVSRIHLELQRAGDRVRLTDLGSTNGTSIGSARLQNGTVFVSLPSTVKVGNVELELVDDRVVERPTPHRMSSARIKGSSPAITRLLQSLAPLTNHSAPVLLLGESGTGKELVARTLHEEGRRREKPFVVVDCGAVSPPLFASELFGHERGAFTNANATHVGAIERANGGTLFLDEIGELPLEQQAALLGVLERKSLRRVGGSKELPVDVRVVAATNRDLRADVNAGSFRLDLYFRLAVVLVTVPPLRERRGDLATLIEHFALEEGVTRSARDLFPSETWKHLENHPWPGNVRELRNMVIAALATGSTPELGHLEAPQTEGDLIAGVLELEYKRARRVITDAFEARYLRRLLERADGSVRQASRLAGIDRGHLSELLKRHGIR